MNDYFQNFFRKIKISKNTNKKTIKEIKSNNLNYNRNPMNERYQTDIFYSQNYNQNTFNNNNEKYIRYYDYNYYINQNNSFINSTDIFKRSMSVDNSDDKYYKKNKNINSYADEKGLNNKNSFNNYKIYNSINNNYYQNNIIYNPINNINKYNIYTFNPNIKTNSSFEFNKKYHPKDYNNYNNIYIFNSNSENNRNINSNPRKVYQISDLNDYFNENFINLNHSVRKKTKNISDINELNVKTDYTSEIKNEKYKKINILSGSAIIHNQNRNKNLKDNNTFYISNPNKKILKIELQKNNNKDRIKQNIQYKMIDLDNNANRINKEKKIFNRKSIKIKNKPLISFNLINKFHEESKQISNNNFFKREHLNTNANSNFFVGNNMIKNYKNKKIKRIMKKNIIPINDNQTMNNHYKKSKKHKILRKKLDLNLPRKNVSTKNSFNNIEKPNPIKNILPINHLQNSIPKPIYSSSAEKVSKKNINNTPSNNVFISIKSSTIQEEKSKENNENNENKDNQKNILNKEKITDYSLYRKKVYKECELCHEIVESHLYKIHHATHPTQILTFLYLGNFSHASNIKELKRLNINYVLNCAIDCRNDLPKNINELHLKIRDLEDFEILDFFELANEFINKCKIMGGNCLVHCKLGVSRSAAIVIAYLIKYYKLTTNEAFDFVKSKRKTIKPNDGFMRQLYIYEKILKENE